MIADSQMAYAPDPATDSSVVEASGLDLTFQTADGPVHALSDVSLSIIGKGEFVSFIGPSGCGKTTFLRVVAALEQPTGGNVTVNGMSPDEARRARAYGYVFQAAGLYPWRTIGGNVRLPLEIMGFSRAEQAQRVKDVLRARRSGGVREEIPLAAFGRNAAAGLHRAGAGVRCGHPAHGRALRRARRDRAGPPERGTAESLGANAENHRFSSPTRSPRRSISRPDRGDEPAPGPDHRRDRQPSAEPNGRSISATAGNLSRSRTGCAKGSGRGTKMPDLVARNRIARCIATCIATRIAPFMKSRHGGL